MAEYWPEMQNDPDAIARIKKSVELLDAKEGMTVLDPFAGSGTSLVSAKRLGRKYIGIELSQKYCDIANERLAQDLLF